MGWVKYRTARTTHSGAGAAQRVDKWHLGKRLESEYPSGESKLDLNPLRREKNL